MLPESQGLGIACVDDDVREVKYNKQIMKSVFCRASVFKAQSHYRIVLQERRQNTNLLWLRILCVMGRSSGSSGKRRRRELHSWLIGEAVPGVWHSRKQGTKGRIRREASELSKSCLPLWELQKEKSDVGAWGSLPELSFYTHHHRADELRCIVWALPLLLWKVYFLLTN